MPDREMEDIYAMVRDGTPIHICPESCIRDANRKAPKYHNLTPWGFFDAGSVRCKVVWALRLGRP